MNPPRIGLGLDLHRLAPGRRCVLGGVEFDCEVGPDGHSDADALLHALCDAVLGAAGCDDLGTLFPDQDPANAARDSAEFCDEALRQIRGKGLKVVSLDAVVECERPKIGPRRADLRARIGELFDVDPERVNVNGKTGEGLGAVGEGAAVRASAVALLIDD